MDLSAEQFYDDLAGDYHLILPADFWLVCQVQGEVLERLLGPPPARVLDVSCGIGTQALGLADRGYDVVGTDLSAAAVERARREAASRGLEAEFRVADMRTVDDDVEGPFAGVISCDNSLAHLHAADDLATAFGAAHRVLTDGGTFVASMRDYDQLASERPGGLPGSLHEDGGGRRIVTQVWEWSAEGDLVRIHQLVARQEGDRWPTRVRSITMRAWRRAELTDALEQAGFADVTWLEPDESDWYQPVVTARAG